MKDLKDFFDTPGLLHIGEQIVKYFGVNDFWNLRQVNKYWKIAFCIKSDGGGKIGIFVCLSV